ncbi:O-antigen ligase family protein [Novosphingobium sp. SG707]|uniref:O-antigen ligase family protein n=1 Tax=Novosphingobium sp. SG707 TaxID=2586996 RepID=UPI001445F08A|nr:O-antigen ligase family protein [Novosphingobium sp. SG707]NKJ03013.1 hypothetical protein [Novosphingobium sp. SG707]
MVTVQEAAASFARARVDAGNSEAAQWPEHEQRRGWRWQVALVVCLLGFWDGFPFSIFGASMVFSYQLYSAIVFAGFILYIVRALIPTLAVGWWEGVSLLLFCWCVLVSFHWSVFVQPQPLLAWLPAIFTVGPVLTIFLLKAVGATRRDAESGLYYAGAFGSLLVAVHVALGLHFLDNYARGSAFTEGRIVFFKLQAVFGLMVGLMRTAQARHPLNTLAHAFASVLMCYNVFVLTESRQLILAVFLALVPIWAFALRGQTRIIIGMVAPFIVIPLGIYAVNKYLPNFSSMSDYLGQDISTQYRVIEDQHFHHVFDLSSGMGFGFMSGDPKYNNVLTFASQSAGFLYGTGKYGVGLVDIGLVSALYQFGYIGFLLVVGMTLTCVIRLVTATRFGQDYASTSALGYMMAALMLNPIAVNYYTLFYSAHIGALLWFIASQVRAEQALAVKAT